jgi:hypothetical protein
MFEREWGSTKWILIYIMSAVGCSTLSNFVDGNSVAVGSSGAVMGMYAAKLAQVATYTFFDVRKADVDDEIRLDQLSSVLCGLVLVSLLGSFTYIDWSGNMGGLLTGFLSGSLLFSSHIRSCCWRFLWGTVSLLALCGSVASILYLFIDTVEPDEQLANSCEYFRGLFPEGYECGCFW